MVVGREYIGVSQEALHKVDRDRPLKPKDDAHSLMVGIVFGSPESLVRVSSESIEPRLLNQPSTCGRSLVGLSCCRLGFRDMLDVPSIRVQKGGRQTRGCIFTFLPALLAFKVLFLSLRLVYGVVVCPRRLRRHIFSTWSTAQTTWKETGYCS